MSEDTSTGQRQRRIFRGEIEKTVRELLKKQFDVDIDLRFYVGGKNRIYAYKDCEIEVDEKRKGIYFGTLEKDGLRLSIEGSFIVGKLARKNVLEVSDKEAFEWLTGKNLEKNVVGYWIVKWGEYFLGCGKGNGKIFRNYVPKERRLSET